MMAGGAPALAAVLGNQVDVASLQQEVRDRLAEGMRATFETEAYNEFNKQNSLTPMELSGARSGPRSPSWASERSTTRSSTSF